MDMNRKGNHIKGPSHTEEELNNPNGVYRNVDVIDEG